MQGFREAPPRMIPRLADPRVPYLINLQPEVSDAKPYQIPQFGI